MAEIASGKIRFSVVVEFDQVESHIGEHDDEEVRARVARSLRESILKGISSNGHAGHVMSVSVRERNA